jgi:hypothetical protein
MNSHLMRVVAESRQQDMLREVRQARRAAGLRAHPIFAARLIRSIISPGGARQPAAEPPVGKALESDA